ncbi:hypothetical protein C7S18_14680 [Ahniella affigens]|uniref:Uncharacterized protein n=1 Tax=Ahniella affigens TaxID=2021234 RepID=A0A2P1PU30_9GAMM|nr:hypothetical protein C7S18_14680 [Ahniella affigens]
METMSPSATTFRTAVVIAVLCSVLAAVLPAYGFSGIEPNVAQFTEYSTHGALLPPEALYWGSMAAGTANAIGLVGLFFFWSAARFCCSAALSPLYSCLLSQGTEFILP